MVNLHERMLPTSAGVEPATFWSPVGRHIQLSHKGRQRSERQFEGNDNRQGERSVICSNEKDVGRDTCSNEKDEERDFEGYYQGQGSDVGRNTRMSQ